MKVISGFTAAQEFGFDMSVVRSYSANHTGGTTVTPTGNTAKKNVLNATSSIADMRIATTGALTAGTQTFDANPIGQDTFSDLAAAATVQHNATFEYDMSQEEDEPIVLNANEGIVVRNLILMGAGGTARLTVDLDWQELERY
jgi:hypothetical protein